MDNLVIIIIKLLVICVCVWFESLDHLKVLKDFILVFILHFQAMLFQTVIDVILPIWKPENDQQIIVLK